jgi:hypothetical protein
MNTSFKTVLIALLITAPIQLFAMKKSLKPGQHTTYSADNFNVANGLGSHGSYTPNEDSSGDIKGTAVIDDTTYNVIKIFKTSNVKPSPVDKLIFLGSYKDKDYKTSNITSSGSPDGKIYLWGTEQE